MKNSIKKDLMNNDIITRKYTTEVQGSIFAIAFKWIKLKLIKTVEVEADIVDTVPCSRRIGWTTVMNMKDKYIEINLICMNTIVGKMCLIQ